MSLQLRFWKTRRATFAARRTSPRRGTCFRPQVEALETRLVPAMVPLTVTIPRLEMIDDTDPDFIFVDRPDYYAIVTIDGVELPRSSIVSGVNLTLDWSFTRDVDNNKARIPVTIHVYDEDDNEDDSIRLGALQDELVFSVDPLSGRWDNSPYAPRYPTKQSEGTDVLGTNARVFFDIKADERDEDMDGLKDDWEVNGIDTDNNWDNGPELNLPLWGARRNHKDLFLELDWMAGAEPVREEIQALKAAFAAAPIDAGVEAATLGDSENGFGVNSVPNPDNLPGINLHVDTGKLTDASGQLVGDDLGGGNQVRTLNVSGLNINFRSIKNGDNTHPAEFDEARREVFHYAISATLPTNMTGTSASNAISGPNASLTLNDINQNWVADEWVRDGTPLVVTITGGTGAGTKGTSRGRNNTLTTLNDTTGAWRTNQWAGYSVTILDGKGAGSTRQITSNTETELTVNTPWAAIPDDTSTYSIQQEREIIDNTATRLLVNTPWATIPDNTSTYAINGEVGGEGDVGGNDFIDYNHDAGTLMHELGHNLNLRHGGFEERNYKPNYLSVMNYDLTFGIPQNSGATVLDYSPAKVSVGGATSGGNTATTLNDTAGKWEVDQWRGAFVELGSVTGVSTGPNGENTLDDATQAWGANYLARGFVTLPPFPVPVTPATPTGLSPLQTRRIVSNTATRLTLNEPWDFTPGAGVNYTLRVRQVRRVESNTANQLVLTQPWLVVPRATVPYALYTATQNRSSAALPLIEKALDETLVLDPADTANQMVFAAPPPPTAPESPAPKFPYPLNGRDRNLGSGGVPAPDGVVDGPDYDGDGIVDTATVEVNVDAPNDTVISGAPMKTQNDWRSISLPFFHFRNSRNAAAEPDPDPLPTLDVLIQNVVGYFTPRITGLHLASTSVDENGPVTLTGGFLDAGSFDTHTVTVDWGDGVIDAPVALAVGARSFTLTHRYRDDNPTGTPSDGYTIKVRVTDNDGLIDTATTAITVANVAPQLANVAVTPEIDENGVVTLSGDVIDPGTQDTFTLVVDWGEGSPQSFSYPAGTTHFSETHQYRDDNPTSTPQDVYAIGLTLADDDTGRATATAITLVKNVAPVFTALATSSTSAGPAREGEPVTISGAFTDVGTLDTHTVTVDWGDGAVELSQVTEAGGAGSFVGQHAYHFGGIYPVLVTLRDDDTGEVSRVKAVFVTGVGVHVVGGLTSLQVVGTIGPDQVSINRQGNGRVTVHADFLRGGKRTLPLAGLDIIQVVLLAGDDHAGIAGNVGLPAVLDGGDGDDHLNGSNAGSVVIGGRGDDHLNGGNARDILIGGPGADRLVANGGDDILMGGFTAYDSGPDDDKLANDITLLRLLGEWNSDRPHAERVANLRDGSGPLLGGTGRRLRKGTTVFDDPEGDVLTGSSGIDWFFFDPLKDKRSGRTGEEVTD